MTPEATSVTLEAASVSFALVLARCASFIGFSPWLGERDIPRTVKVGLAGALTLVWFDPLTGPSALSLAQSRMAQSFLFGWLVGREVLLGALLGYLLRLVVLPARLAGSYLGQEMGLTLATLADPSSPTGSNVFAQLLEVVAGVLFFTLDIHHWVLAGLGVAFDVLPMGGALPGSAGMLASQVDAAGEKALLLIAPAGIALFITTAALTLLTRSVPQLNLFSVGFPLRLVVGIAVAAACLPKIAELLSGMMMQGGAWWLLEIR
jgi:flagellar biosynthetic protein FliR